MSIKTALITIDPQLTALNSWLSTTTIVTVVSVVAINTTTILIMYT